MPKPNAGPIAPVHNGDPVKVDVPARTVGLRGDAAELDKRKTLWKPPAPEFTRGWLARYQRLVTSAARGAVLAE